MPRNERLRTRRIERDLTQTELAEIIGASDKTVHCWEAGRNRPQGALMVALMRELGASTPEELGFSPSARRGPRGTVTKGTNGQKGPAVLNRRDLLAIVSGAMGGVMVPSVAAMFPTPTETANIGASDVARVRRLWIHSRSLQHMMGGGALNGKTLLQEYGTVLGTLHGKFRSARTREQMHAEVAHYGTVVAWSLVEQGLHAPAQRVYGAAIAAAGGAAAGRRDGLRVLLLTGMARQSIYRGDHGTAFALLDHADAVSAKLPGDIQAQVLSRRVRALALRGDVAGVARLARSAEDRYEASPRQSAQVYENPAFGRAELMSDLGYGYTTLAVAYGLRSTQAEPQLVQCVRSYGAGEQRSRTLARLWLTNLHLTHGDTERALSTARGVAAAAGSVQSAQIGVEIQTGLRLAAKRPNRGTAQVTEVLRAIHPNART